MVDKDIIKEIVMPASSDIRPVRCVNNIDIKLAAENAILDYNIKTVREDKSIFIYDKEKGYYVSNGETYLATACVRSPTFNTRRIYNELLFNIMALSFIDMKDIETTQGFINLKNGVYDIENDIILPFSPKYNFRYRLNIEYDHNTSCGLFEKMVRNMTDTEEDYNLIQKWFGCHFILRQVKKSLFMVGPTNTSKSTLCTTLAQLIGEKNCSAHSIQDLTSNNKYFISDLNNKLANINADTSIMKLKDISTFKLLTGGDLISARIIHKMPFQFRNRAKLTFAFNRLPNIDNSILSDMAFWERIMIINVKKGYDQKDEHIEKKLYKELPGIFNWAIEGLKNYLKEGFNHSKTYEEIIDIWTKNMSNSNTRNRKISELELLNFPFPEDIEKSLDHVVLNPR